MQEIILSEEYLVNVDGTSEGSQQKYFKDGIWYKKDFFGGEGQAEELASLLLSCSNLEPSQYVMYQQIRLNYSDGCCSEDFLKPNEQFVTIYRLYANMRGRNIAQDLVAMKKEDRCRYVLDFMQEVTGLDLHTYFANVMMLDKIIRNEDRHFNNVGVIFDGSTFKEAPIFDNGKSFFVGNYSVKAGLSISENIKRTSAKSFSGSFEWNSAFFEEYRTISFDWNLFREKVDYAKFGKLPFAKELLEFQEKEVDSFREK